MLDWSKPGKKYGEMAAEFAARLGRKSHPVITRKDHPQQWRDWYAYYGWRKLKFSQELMREREEKMVPALSPFDFDAEFNPTRSSPEVPQDSKPPALPKMTDQRRAMHQLKYPHLLKFPAKDAAE